MTAVHMARLPTVEDIRRKRLTPASHDVLQFPTSDPPANPTGTSDPTNPNPE